jgi:hypothetical protein
VAGKGVIQPRTAVAGRRLLWSLGERDAHERIGDIGVLRAAARGGPTSDDLRHRVRIRAVQIPPFAYICVAPARDAASTVAQSARRAHPTEAAERPARGTSSPPLRRERAFRASKTTIRGIGRRVRTRRRVVAESWHGIVWQSASLRGWRSR